MNTPSAGAAIIPRPGQPQSARATPTAPARPVLGCSVLSKIEALKEQFGQQRGLITALCHLSEDTIACFPLRIIRVRPSGRAGAGPGFARAPFAHSPSARVRTPGV